MIDIIHRVGIKAGPSEVYHALTTEAGLSSWWTSDTRGTCEVETDISFHFNQQVPVFTVCELRENEWVSWRFNSATPEEWIGTSVSFEIQPADDQTFVRFMHSNWQSQSNFTGHCSLKWATFMLSLKDALETGTGKPFPNDVQIDHS